MAPRDEAMLVHMLRTALAHDGPGRRCATRAARREGVALPARAAGDPDRHAARSCARASGSRCSATATASQVALEAAELLAEHGLHVTVADARFAKPLDAELLERLAPSTTCS